METDACYIVRDANGQALGYFYFDEEQQSPAINRRSRATMRGAWQ